MIDRHKYLVVRREDVVDGIDGEPFPGMDEPQVSRALTFDSSRIVRDAVVLRKADRLAIGAIHAYASQVAAAAQLLLDAGHPETAQPLFDLADFMAGEAADAEIHARRLPTP